MKFELLYEDYEIKFYKQSIYPLLELIKQELFCFICVILQDFPVIQIILYLLLSICSIIYYSSLNIFFNKLAFRFTQFNDTIFITSVFTFNLLIQIPVEN